MKKYILSLLAITSLGLTVNANPVEDLTGLVQLIQKQKDAWFDFKKAKEAAELDLIKSEHDKMFADKLEHLKSKADLLNTGIKGPELEKMLADKVQKVIAMYTAKMTDWENFCKQWEAKGMALGKSQKAEFEKLISGFKTMKALPVK